MNLNLTLRTKGILAFIAIVVYVAVIALYVSHQRQRLLHIVEKLEQVHAKQQLLIRVNTSLGHSIVELQGMLNVETRKPRYGDVINDIQAVASGMRALKTIYPAMVSADTENLELNIASLWAVPSRNNLSVIRDSELKLIGKLNDITKALQEKADDLSEVYRNINQTIPLVAMLMYVIGLGTYGTVVLLFFTRIASDIKRLKVRALAVATGYRGEPLGVTRSDELGGLMEAVNRMQAVLRRTEQRQEISRQQRFHQEKMAAVGSMASAIGHEVSNPMAAISGISQCIIDITTPQPGLEKERSLNSIAVHDHAELILQHTERIAAIMRQMSTLTERSSPEPELLDVNALIRATCGFIGYDNRFRRIKFELDLDPELPAITAMADHLTQILMNLLINAADAMESQAETRPSTIRITSRQADGQVLLTVSDNGQGMSPELLAQAFKESFTTKPVGKGRGIGLFLCKTLIEEAGGDIALESTPDAGTTARLVLPLQYPETMEAPCTP